MILLCWNRDNENSWPLEDYEEARQTTDEGWVWSSTWSVGNRINIPIGSECFLLVQGQKHPRGLVAYGITTSLPELDTHYADPEKETRYVDIDWQEMLELDDVIPVQILSHELAEIPWATGGIRSSGFPVKPEYQEKLIDIWTHYSGEDEEREPGEVDVRDFFEGGVRTITVNRYERDPRARRACLAHYGSTCFVCGVDLVKIYGKTLGQTAIHVHHIKPMATRVNKPYIIDPVKDLIPLCPNCHNVIHKTAPVMTPKALRKQVRTLGRK